MPIPVDGSGNVDGEGGAKNFTMRSGPLAYTGWLGDLQGDPILRIRMEPPRIQPGGSVRWTWSAFDGSVVRAGSVLLPPFLALIPVLEELTNDADSDGADGS